MAPQYKLTYFNGRGRAEVIRLVFAVAGVEYEDVRIEKDAWPAMKPDTPFGQLPILSVDGVVLCQSNAIARFVARKYNLAGKSDLEQAQADMVADCIEDALKPMIIFFMEKDETKKTELKKKFSEEQLPVSLGGLEKILKSNKGGDGFFVGSGLTWADLSLSTFRDFLTICKFEGEIEKHPKLNALLDRVGKEPKVAAWVAKRPATEF